MMKHYIFGSVWGLLVLISLGGCASRGGPGAELLSTLPEGEEIYLDSEVEREKRIHEFLQNTANITEQEKIQFLLHSVKTSGATFFRNGGRYDSTIAFRWLRWKMTLQPYREVPLADAGDFILRVCRRSEATGVPYQIQLNGGKVVNLGDVLRCELDALEMAIQEHMARKSLNAEMRIKRSKQTAVPVAPLLPATT